MTKFVPILSVSVTEAPNGIKTLSEHAHEGSVDDVDKAVRVLAEVAVRDPEGAQYAVVSGRVFYAKAKDGRGFQRLELPPRTCVVFRGEGLVTICREEF